jgi:hypothetical protein
MIGAASKAFPEDQPYGCWQSLKPFQEEMNMRYQIISSWNDRNANIDLLSIILFSKTEEADRDRSACCRFMSVSKAIHRA